MDFPQPTPTIPFALTLVGSFFQLAALFYLIYNTLFVFPTGWLTGPGMMACIMSTQLNFGFGWVVSGLWWVVVAGVIVGLGFFGALMMNTSDVQTMRTGAILAHIAAILAFPVIWGFYIGSILMLIGSILGLRWRRPRYLEIPEQVT